MNFLIYSRGLFFYLLGEYMKNIFGLMAISLISFSVHASSITLRVTETFCGEVDPFAIGDACLIQASSEKRNYALVIDLDEYQYSDLVNAKENDLITINNTYLERINDTNVINEINDYFNIYYSKYFYYELLFPTDSVVNVEKAQIKSSYKLSCSQPGFFDGSYMWGKVRLTASLDVLSGDTYILSKPDFSYTLSMDEDYSYIWAQGSSRDANYTITNLRTYRPQVYLGHIKFDDIFYKDIFGQIDFILPKDKLNTNDDEIQFTSYMIMTAMDDHWGGTVSIDCTISK